MHFSKKSINKTIASIDRYFTWDTRELIPGNMFRAYNYDTECHVSFRPFDFNGNYWFYYKTNTGHKYTKIISNYRDLNELNKLIKVMFT